MNRQPNTADRLSNNTAPSCMSSSSSSSSSHLAEESPNRIDSLLSSFYVASSERSMQSSNSSIWSMNTTASNDAQAAVSQDEVERRMKLTEQLLLKAIQLDETPIR
eukprot:CAMPEP_0202451580 /NCGR_PEP_ID=MMETSP1360-20130828/9984_1 /ASSEMBLY_ACC=CAM_ASM_000848 /TAXON_ID=515479 /ORGANISM="Licmophora paradoxa, Strain CCMP2313" /LENGTH=105 /DNA_ID=CAMNT_0049070183 /DNA_START=102 /DNA_END=419 /DNA_ORIENTATION=-